MGDDVGITAIVKLPQQLAIRDLLRGIQRPYLKQSTQQHGFSHRLHLQHVLRDRRLDDGVPQITQPAGRIAPQRRSARISSQHKKVVKRIPERLSTFGKSPLRRPQNLESTLERLRHAALQRKRQRAREHNLHVVPTARVLIPKVFNRRRPFGNFLNLIER